MTNYDMDELLQREEFGRDMIEHEKRSVHDTRILGKDEEAWPAIDVEIPDADFIRIAHEAHTRDITINKMLNIILKNGIENAEYRFEHNSKPQLLNEDK